MDLLIEKYKKYEPFFGGWYIKSLLGEGGYGAVFEVEKIEFDTNYKAALKIVSIPQSESELKSMLSDGLDEASTVTYYEDILHKMMGEIDLMVKMKGHSNIVSCEDHQVIPHDGSIGWDIIIRMELLTPIVDYQKTHPFTERDVIELGIDICEALEVCKRHKIIHRDIKPENIFVSSTDNYKLGDFGIARTMENTKGASTKAGTGRYMAPEVYRGERYNDTVDLYSLGLVLYRYLNENRLPFYPPYPQPIRYSDQETAQEKRLSGEILPKAIHASEEITKIINKACAFKPGDRYQTAADMKNDLLQLKKIREGQTEADILNSSFSGQSENEESNTYDKTEVIRPEIEETISIFSGRNENIEFIEAKNTVKEASDSISLNERIPEESEKTVGIFSDVPKTVNDVTKASKNKKKTNVIKKIIMVALVLVSIGVWRYGFGDYLIRNNTDNIENDNEELQFAVSNNVTEELTDVFGEESELDDIDEWRENDSIKLGDIIEFGSYEQDNDLSNGPEPIEWYIVDKTEEELILTSVYILDSMPYNETKEITTWEECSLREWLNNDFYNVAFSEEEKNSIQTSSLPHTSLDNLPYGQTTHDKVYIISLANYHIYGYRWHVETTNYAIAKGVKCTDEGYGQWWIAAPGKKFSNALVVNAEGTYGEGGINVDREDVGVRPTIKIRY